MRTLNSRLWTADVARRAGCSVQQVRNLERDGVLPPARRTATGYRVYDEIHVRSALAYRALAAGAGPVEAKRIMRTLHSGTVREVLTLLDAVHARLDAERRTLALAKEAAQAIAHEPIRDVRTSDTMSVSELAGAIGVRVSTLRHWDAVGLVAPHRQTARGARRYSPDAVRDARVVQQLRLAGYRIPALQDVLPQLRSARGWTDVAAALDTRDASIDARSRALLDAAATLAPLLAGR